MAGDTGVVFSFETSGFQTFANQMREATALADGLNTSLYRTGDGFTTYRKQLSSASKSSNDFAKAGDVITVSLDDVRVATKENNKEIQKYQGEVKKTAMVSDEFKSATVSVVKEVGKAAKDADTAADSLDKLGDGINRVENTARVAAIGLAIFGRALGVPVKAIKTINAGLKGFANVADDVSDGFAEYADEVDKADGEIRDYNEEQGRMKEGGLALIPVLKDMDLSMAVVTQRLARLGLKMSGLQGKEEGGKFPRWLGLVASQFAKLPPPIQAATIAIVGFKVASKIIEVFGARSAGITAMAESFDRLAQSAGLANGYLTEFAESTDNVLTETELLKLSNTALAGTTGEFSKELAESLPLLLDFARARSAATGEDIDFLFNSAIQGIKKAQPLILDNLGLVVDLESVYTKYAESLGITKDQLTGVQEQQAILNEINKEAVRNIGILGDPELSNADKMLARGNIWSDILDQISLAVQPLMTVFLDFELAVLRMFKEALQPVIEGFRALFSIVGDLTSTLTTIMLPIIETLFSVFSALMAPITMVLKVLARLVKVVVNFANMMNKNFLGVLKPAIWFLETFAHIFKVLGDLIVGVIDGLVWVGNAIGSVLQQINPFPGLMDKINERFKLAQQIVSDLARILAYGLGSAFASLVNSAAQAAKAVLSVVADMAEGIASFLIGESPPPKGPLSKIDEGGKKTFEAWLDGFTSLSLDPVEQVLEEVNTQLGDIGRMSLGQVEKRLGQLDKALQPFQERLKIVQAQFDAIAAPAEAAMRAIDRQLNTAVQALTKGDASAKASVQALDAQRAAIQKNLEMQQQQVDFAQIQLALQQGRQAEERALLEIQQARLQGLITEEEAEKAIAKISAPKEAERKMGGASPSLGGEEAGGVPLGDPTDTGNEYGNLFVDGFLENLNFDLLGEIGDEQARLGEAGGAITEGLAGLPDRLAEPFENVFGPEGAIRTAFDDAFGPEGFVKTSIDGLFGEDGIISKPFNDFFGSEGTLANLFNTFFGADGTLSTLFGSAATVITNFVTDLTDFRDDVVALINGEEGSIGAVIEAVFGIDGIILSSLNLSKLAFDTMYNLVFGPEGVLSGVGEAIDAFVNAPILTIAQTTVGIINSVINSAENFVNNIIGGLQTLISIFPDELQGFFSGVTNLGTIDFGEVTLQGLGLNQPTAFNQGTDPLVNLTGGARGGLFTGGLMQVGERGREYIAPASKIGVFPNNFVTAIESLENVLVRSMSIPQGGNIWNNSSSVSNTRYQTININQPMRPGTVRQELNMIG